MKEIKRVLASELVQPSEDLVRFFLSRVYEGRATTGVREQLAELRPPARSPSSSATVCGIGYSQP